MIPSEHLVERKTFGERGKCATSVKRAIIEFGRLCASQMIAAGIFSPGNKLFGKQIIEIESLQQ